MTTGDDRTEDNGWFAITHLSRDDIKMAFEGAPEKERRKAARVMKHITDTDMRYLANKIAEACTGNDTYWQVIREYVRGL